MTITKVGRAEDFAEGKIVPVNAEGHELLVTRVDGAVYAVARKCPHMGADLCGGKITDGAIVCPKHRASFAIATGKPIASAKILFLKMTPQALATFPVTIEGDDIMVRLA